MTYAEIAFKLDELSLHAWSMNGVAMAIQTAMDSGDHVAADYVPAMYALSNMTSELQTELGIVTDALFAANKEVR